jgi:periplasmic divalent cation tolerance protein
MKPLVAMTTIGENDDAAELAAVLVERRLVACVNIIGPIRSIYRWEGRVNDDREQLLIMKTTDARIDELREAVLAIHPYEVPEFVVLPIDDISEGYRDWLVAACAEG